MSQSNLTIIFGVGPGLGQALAHRFATGGQDVALIARSADKLTDMAEAISDETGRTVKAFAGDGTKPESIHAAMAAIASEMGPARVFIHNASRWVSTEATAMDPTLLMDELQLSAGTALIGSQAVLPAMEAAGAGTILWTGSAMALNPEKHGAAPALTTGKCALRGLALAAAPAFHERGVNFATVTINGTIDPETDFAPKKIAEFFWKTHLASRDDWAGEHVFNGGD